MRDSIGYLFLLISFSLLAFQPPEQPKSQLITFADLQQEREKNRESYLSLLTGDLLKQIHDYLPNNLEEAIYAIRSIYLNDPIKREQFLTNETLNAQLINELTLRFRPENTEHMTDFFNKKAALLLNTLPSFAWLRKKIPEDKALGTTMVFGVLEAYLKKLRLNYQHSLDYIKEYLHNSEKSKVAYDISGLTQDTVQYLIKNFKEPHEHVIIPEIKALADLATDPAQNWISLILESQAPYHDENARFLRVLLKSQISLDTQEHYERLRNAVCLSLARLLTFALHNNDHAGIRFIKNVFESVKDLHPSYKSCVNERFAWLLNPSSEQAVAQLMSAMNKKQVDVIRALTEGRYVNVNACDKFGHNALWYARNLETDAATRLAIIELLQTAGATEEEACVVQ